MLYPMSSLTIGRGGDIAGDLFDDDILSVSFTIAVRTLLHLFVCVLLLGLAELSTALADPFTGGYLPLEDMARTTVRDVARARREAAALRALGVGGDGGGAEGDDVLPPARALQPEDKLLVGHRQPLAQAGLVGLQAAALVQQFVTFLTFVELVRAGSHGLDQGEQRGGFVAPAL